MDIPTTIPQIVQNYLSSPMTRWVIVKYLGNRSGYIHENSRVTPVRMNLKTAFSPPKRLKWFPYTCIILSSSIISPSTLTAKPGYIWKGNAASVLNEWLEHAHIMVQRRLGQRSRDYLTSAFSKSFIFGRPHLHHLAGVFKSLYSNFEELHFRWPETCGKIDHRRPKPAQDVNKLFNTDTVTQRTIYRDCMGNWPLS